MIGNLYNWFVVNINWELVPQAFVNGVLHGGVIGLIALGVVLIYKSSEIFNFAQGHMLMLGAFLTWWFAGANEDGKEWLNLPLGYAILAAFITMMLVGFLIERFALRPMSGQPLLSIILMTLGLAQLIEGLASITFGVQPKSNFPAPISRMDVEKFPFEYAFQGIIIVKTLLISMFVVAMIFAIVVGMFFKFTKAGLAMRATSEDHELARSVGLNVPRIFGLSWAIAGVIATAGGILLAMLTGASLTISTVVLVAFPAILLGGLESFPGAIVGGILVGLAQQLVMTAKITEISRSSEIAPYVLLIIILFIRPEGLFGQKRIERI
ncbi:MAG: branched-chain amino acid ABC transporter permease [Anaerolineae bacterium]|nr:branched-chain amino acid ABC transporter permease [Anaerolineae bacterium]